MHITCTLTNIKNILTIVNKDIRLSFFILLISPANPKIYTEEVHDFTYFHTISADFMPSA